MNNFKQIEAILLGAILLNKDSYWDAEHMLDEDCFQDADHGRVYRAVRDRALNGKSITRDLVAASISGELGGVEPGAFLSALVYAAKQEETLYIEEYADALRRTALRRRLIDLASKIDKSARDETLQPAEILDRISERVAEISQSSDIENESTLASSMRRAAVKAQAKNKTNPEGINEVNRPIEPCLAGLKEMFASLPPSSLMLLGGGPGSGKTALAMQQLIFTARTDPASLIELEMDNISLVVRSMKEFTGVSIRDMMVGLNQQGIEKLNEVAQALEGYKLRIASPSKMTINQIRSRAIAHKHKYGLSMLVVDHLKLIKRPSRYKVDPVYQVYENAAELKELAKEIDCAIIALCQFTRASRSREVNPEPEMEDFYGGAIEEHADIILGLFNRYDWLEKNPPRTTKGKDYQDWLDKKQMSKNRIEMYKLKDRFGPPRAQKFFHWDGATTKFSDIDTSGNQQDLDFGS